jgi:hypothetical protein
MDEVLESRRSQPATDDSMPAVSDILAHMSAYMEVPATL